MVTVSQLGCPLCIPSDRIFFESATKSATRISSLVEKISRTGLFWLEYAFFNWERYSESGIIRPVNLANSRFASRKVQFRFFALASSAARTKHDLSTYRKYPCD